MKKTTLIVAAIASAFAFSSVNAANPWASRSVGGPGQTDNRGMMHSNVQGMQHSDQGMHMGHTGTDHQGTGVIHKNPAGGKTSIKHGKGKKNHSGITKKGKKHHPKRSSQ